MLARSCRPSGTPFRGTIPGRASLLGLGPLSPRRDSSRLVNEMAHRCGRGVIAPPAPLGPGWRVTGGGAMARHWQDACVDAVAKLPPVWVPRFGKRSRGRASLLGLGPLSPRRDSSRLVNEMAH